MELACNTYTFRALGRPGVFARLAALGLPTVELWTGHAPYLAGEVSARAVAREAADAGLRLRAYCIGGLFGLPLATVEDRMARALDYARALGVALVVTIADRAAVARIDRLAQDAGIRVALENHWYTELARPADYVPVLAAASPAIGVAIDTGHFAFLDLDLASVARRLGPRTLHVHLKVVQRPGRVARAVRRWRRQMRMEPALPGEQDRLGPFVSALAATGYDGLLAIEHEASGDGDADAAVDRYRARAGALLATLARERRFHARAAHA